MKPFKVNVSRLDERIHVILSVYKAFKMIDCLSLEETKDFYLFNKKVSEAVESSLKDPCIFAIHKWLKHPNMKDSADFKFAVDKSKLKAMYQNPIDEVMNLLENAVIVKSTKATKEKQKEFREGIVSKTDYLRFLIRAGGVKALYCLRKMGHITGKLPSKRVRNQELLTIASRFYEAFKVGENLQIYDIVPIQEREQAFRGKDLLVQLLDCYLGGENGEKFTDWQILRKTKGTHGAGLKLEQANYILPTVPQTYKTVIDLLEEAFLLEGVTIALDDVRHMYDSGIYSPREYAFVLVGTASDLAADVALRLTKYYDPR